MTEHAKDWDELISYCLFNYNTVHASTKHTPYFTLHEKEPRTSFNLVLHDASLKNNTNLFTYVKQLAEKI